MKMFLVPVALLSLPMLAAPSQAQRPTSFSIDLSLSPRAAAELASRNERITVSTSFMGEPTRAHRRAAVQGEIGLGSDEVQIPGRSGSVVVSTRRLQRARLGWVREPIALVNVFTSRLSGADNLLDCGIIQEPLRALVGQRRPISCKLIGEEEAAGTRTSQLVEGVDFSRQPGQPSIEETYPDAAGMPQDVQAYIIRWNDCQHWQGEPGFDAGRRRQIRNAVNTACAGVDALGRRVRSRHAGESAVMSRLRDYDDLER